MNAVRWGMIGCGAVCERKSAPAFSLAPGSRLDAVWARRAEQAQDYARRHGVPRVAASAQALISDPDIDAVYVATPPASHLQYALLAAEAGKPCCVEKPIANTYADARRMVEAFERAGAPLFTAYYRRSLPRFEQARAFIKAGEIGAVRHVHWMLARPARPGDLAGGTHWRIDPEAAPRGYFDDLASHGLDLFRHFFGDFAAFGGVGVNQQGVYTAPDAFAASWRHASGVTGAGSWTFNADRRVDEVVVLGGEGRMRFSMFEDAPIEVEGRTSRSVFVENPDPVQLPHVTAMVRRLTGGPAHPAEGAANLNTAWAMDQISV